MYNKADVFVVTITGMGGIGKSELAKNFAKQISVDAAVDCIWLNGESINTLKNSITRLQKSLKLPKLDENEYLMTAGDLFVYIISSIEDNKRILVIVDNVDEANQEVMTLILNVPEGRCFFLVTSRNVGVFSYGGALIRLEILSDEEAINLLKASDISGPDDDIKKLCYLLENFPLALHQAAAYIKQEKYISVQGKSYQISDYLKIYERKQQVLLDHKVSPIEHEYRVTTFITWKISFEKVQKDENFGNLAMQLLNTIAYFQANGIEIEFINLYQNDLEEAIPLLKTYSLVKGEDGVVSIHRLIQQVIRINLRSDELEIPQLINIISTIQPILESTEPFVSIIGELDPENYEDSMIEEERSLKHIRDGMGHVVSVWKHAAKHPVLLNDFQNAFLQTNNNLRYFQLYDQILDLCYATLGQVKETFGPSKELTLQIESELANADWKFVFYFRREVSNEKQILQLQSVYAMQKQLFGEEHKSTLTTAHYIAELEFSYWNKASGIDKTEGLKLCTSVAESKTKVFGPRHKSTMSSVLLLADYKSYVYFFHLDASILFEQCWQWQITHFGADRSDTQRITDKYVHSLVQIDDYLQAKFVLEHLLQQRLTKFKFHVYERLSLVLYCLGEIEEAYAKLRLGIASIKDNDKLSTFDLKISQHKIADSLLNEGSYMEALEIYKKLDIDRFHFDWWWIDVQYRTAQCLIGLKYIKEAHNILQKLVNLPTEGAKSKPRIEIKKLLEDMKKILQPVTKSQLVLNQADNLSK